MNITGILQSIRNAGRAKNSSDVQSAEPSFFWFIWQEKRNRRFVWIMLIGTIAQFVVFKLLYPFADFFSDSYSYIYAASANLDINIWPIGYSKFLRYFHFITYSDTALIAFQYFFLELSCLYFFFTILYFYRPVKANQIILFIFLFFNPLFLYVSNYVNSDPIFIALSVLWFTELLWILQRPNLNHILIQGLLLFLCFTVRNNAYIYPFVTLVAFALSRLRLWVKVFGTALGLLFIIPFIEHTRNAAYKMTGTKQFSLFTGWQLANNALYMYEWADTIKNLSAAGHELDHLSKKFYSQAPPEILSEYIRSAKGNYFIQHPYSPLKKYLKKHYRSMDDYENVVNWGKASAIYEEYGEYLIENNIMAYVWGFALPNTRNYFLPLPEKLDIYNLGSDRVGKKAVTWFAYKDDKITSISKTAQGKLLYLASPFFFIINVYLSGCLLWFLFKKIYRDTTSQLNKTILVAVFFQLANAIFCVSTTIIVLRYQIFPMIICSTFALILTEWLEIQGNVKNKINLLKDINKTGQTTISAAIQ